MEEDGFNSGIGTTCRITKGGQSIWNQRREVNPSGIEPVLLVGFIRFFGASCRCSVLLIYEWHAWMIHSPSPCPLLSISHSLVMTMTPEMEQTHAHVSLATRSIASPPIMKGSEVLRLSSILGIVYLLACTKTDIVPRHSPSNSHAIE